MAPWHWHLKTGFPTLMESAHAEFTLKKKSEFKPKPEDPNSVSKFEAAADKYFF